MPRCALKSPFFIIPLCLVVIPVALGLAAEIEQYASLARVMIGGLAVSVLTNRVSCLPTLPRGSWQDSQSPRSRGRRITMTNRTTRLAFLSISRYLLPVEVNSISLIHKLPLQAQADVETVIDGGAY
jgi:hypothetical protein